MKLDIDLISDIVFTTVFWVICLAGGAVVLSLMAGALYR
jgi:hypothetical protein